MNSADLKTANAIVDAVADAVSSAAPLVVGPYAPEAIMIAQAVKAAIHFAESIGQGDAVRELLDAELAAGRQRIDAELAAKHAGRP